MSDFDAEYSGKIGGIGGVNFFVISAEVDEPKLITEARHYLRKLAKNKIEEQGAALIVSDAA